MHMTSEQQTAIRAALSTDLATLDTDRLIALCLLYRAQPTAHDTFPAALEAEINRRFTAQALAEDDTLYSVLTHFANQFQSAIPRFHLALQEMAGTVNRDIWFTDHAELFQSALNNEDVAHWLTQPAQNDILNKILRNRIALGFVAQSTVAATAVLREETAVALWKDAPDVWDIWPQHAQGMTVLAKSTELTQYVIDTPQALAACVASAPAMTALAASPAAMRPLVTSSTGISAVAASQTAMNAVAASQTAMSAVAASQTAMSAVAASQTAMSAVVASQTAMSAVAASQTAMSAVAASQTALATVIATAAGRNALMANNDVLQSLRTTLYDTIKTAWVKVRHIAMTEANGGARYYTGNSAFAEPENALVFACLGAYSAVHPGARSVLEHPDGRTAAEGGYRETPRSMVAVDAVSFAGAKLKQTVQYIGAYVEVWKPA